MTEHRCSTPHHPRRRPALAARAVDRAVDRGGRQRWHVLREAGGVVAAQSVSVMADSIDFFGDAAHHALSLAVAGRAAARALEGGAVQGRVHGRLRGVRARATTPPATWR